MLFCSVKNEGCQNVQSRVKDAVSSGHLGIELRLDLCPHVDLETVRQIVQGQPTLLTVRSQMHGGKFQGSEAQRELFLEKLIALQPAYVDLEYDMRPGFLQAMIPRTQCILSYHNTQEVPADLKSIYQQMRRYDAFSYKIAAQAQSTSQALRLLLFAKAHARCSAIAMG